MMDVSYPIKVLREAQEKASPTQKQAIIDALAWLEQGPRVRLVIRDAGMGLTFLTHCGRSGREWMFFRNRLGEYEYFYDRLEDYHADERDLRGGVEPGYFIETYILGWERPAQKIVQPLRQMDESVPLVLSSGDEQKEAVVEEPKEEDPHFVRRAQLSRMLDSDVAKIIEERGIKISEGPAQEKKTRMIEAILADEVREEALRGVVPISVRESAEEEEDEGTMTERALMEVGMEELRALASEYKVNGNSRKKLVAGIIEARKAAQA